MAELLLLDTHAWVDVVVGAPLPTETLRRVRRAVAEARLRLAAISLWEVAMLSSKGKLQLASPLAAWLETSLTRSGVVLVPLDAAIAAESVELPGTFHGDPADRLIVATARCLRATLLTRDRKILAYAQSKLVHAIALA